MWNNGVVVRMVYGVVVSVAVGGVAVLPAILFLNDPVDGGGLAPSYMLCHFKSSDLSLLF